jgi:hypothetical protein
MVFQLREKVKITSGFFANEAFEIAKKNKVNNYMGMGTIVKVPGDNDHILSKKITGTEKMVDNYNVVLEVNPHNYYWNKTVTYLEESDLEKVE